MRKKVGKIIVFVGIVLILLGSFLFVYTRFRNNTRAKYPELPDDAIAFRTTSFVDTEDDGAGYQIIEYSGRKYIPYGTIKRVVKESDINKCIGYVIQDENVTSMPDENNKNTRIYTLTEDPDNNFLMSFYIVSNFMNPHIFYRAIDTKGEDISIPSYIHSLDYNYWK